jgi:hypothetical protein
MRLNHLVGILVVGGLAFGTQLGAAQYESKKAPAAKRAAAKSGGTHSMTGCLAKGTEPNTWMLTNIEGNGPKQAELIEVPANLNLNAHVGHKVEITGTTIRAKAAARAEAGAKKPTAAEAKQEPGEHHMKPTALKMVANSCS